MALSINSSTAYNSLYSLESNTGKAESLEDSLTNVTEDSTDEELLEVCKSFESYFIEQVFKEMKKSVEESVSNEYTEYFGDMLYQEYAEQITESGSIGLAQQLYESMKR